MLAGVTACVVALSACANSEPTVETAKTVPAVDDEPRVEITTTTRSEQATAQDHSAEALRAEIVRAIEKFWAVISRGYFNPDSLTYEDLAEVATGPQLEHSWGNVQELRRKGLAGRFPSGQLPEHHVEILSAAEEQVTARDCATDDGVIYEVKTGRVVDDDVVTQLWEITLRRVGQEWKVESTKIIISQEGRTVCSTLLHT